MTTVVIQQEQEAIRITDWVGDLASFRRWAKSDEYPERGWYAHLDGELWADPSRERLIHNLLKMRIAVVLTLLADQARTGRFLGDRMLLTNIEAALSTEPAGMFISDDSIREGRVRLEEGENSVEVEGSPDMVLEVISPTSVQKDSIVLRNFYWRAGVREYWLADPRAADPTLEILRHGTKGYVSVRKRSGWLNSAVVAKSFRLSRSTDPLGNAQFSLEVA